MTTQLKLKKCAPCEEGTSPLQPDAIERWSSELSESWKVVEGKRLERKYSFNDFQAALAFTNRVGMLAEQEGHHPDIHLGWGKVVLTLSTHSIGGLSENDFILAAKADELK